MAILHPQFSLQIGNLTHSACMALPWSRHCFIPGTQNDRVDSISLSVPHPFTCHLLVKCPLWMTKPLPPQTPQCHPPWFSLCRWSLLELFPFSVSLWCWSVQILLRGRLVFVHVSLIRGQCKHPVLLCDKACPLIRYQYGFSFISRGEKNSPKLHFLLWPTLHRLTFHGENS